MCSEAAKKDCITLFSPKLLLVGSPPGRGVGGGFGCLGFKLGESFFNSVQVDGPGCHPAGF